MRFLREKPAISLRPFRPGLMALTEPNAPPFERFRHYGTFSAGVSCLFALSYPKEPLMSMTQTLAPHLPYLRRYARALTGSQTSGDAHVRAALQALLTGDQALAEGAPPRV